MGSPANLRPFYLPMLLVGFLIVAGVYVVLDKFAVKDFDSCVAAGGQSYVTGGPGTEPPGFRKCRYIDPKTKEVLYFVDEDYIDPSKETQPGPSEEESETPASESLSGVEETTEPTAEGWSHFSSSDLGLAFDYPNAWGSPDIIEETGQENGDYNGCIYQRAATFPSLEEHGWVLVLAAVNTHTCQAPGREAYWGDAASTFVPDHAFMAQCETGVADRCETFRTTSRELVWHWHYPTYTIPLGPETYADINEYGLFHDGHPLSGVIISDQRLVQYGFEDQQDELRTLVESISFVDE